jgi:hypothetical protein
MHSVGAVAPFRSTASAPGALRIGGRASASSAARPASFVGDFLVIGVECLFDGRGMRDGVWPGVLAADRGTVCDFLGVVNSRAPEAERGRWRLLMLMLPILPSLRSLSES